MEHPVTIRVGPYAGKRGRVVDTAGGGRVMVELEGGQRQVFLRGEYSNPRARRPAPLVPDAPLASGKRAMRSVTIQLDALAWDELRRYVREGYMGRGTSASKQLNLALRRMVDELSIIEREIQEDPQGDHDPQEPHE